MSIRPTSPPGIRTRSGTVSVSATETVVDRDPSTVRRARDAFARYGALFVPDLLDPDLGRMLRGIVAGAGFAPDVAGAGTRATETPDRAGTALRLILARPELLAWLERVTGCGPIDRAAGAVTRLTAGSGHALDWHADMVEGRRLAITIDLTGTPYEGGALELRDRPSGVVTLRHVHRETDGALIFGIGRDLEHRVLPITAGGPRTVFAGWFLASDPRDDGPT